MNVGKRLLGSGVMNLADHAVKFAAMFLLTPVLAAGWGGEGDTRYSVWLLLMAFFGMYQFLDLGLGLAAVRFLARAAGKGDTARAADVFVTVRALFNKVALASLALTAAGLLFVPAYVGGGADPVVVRWVIAVYGVSIALKFALAIYTATLKSELRYGAIAIASMLRVAVQTAVMFQLVRSGQGLVAAAILFACAEIGQSLLQFAFALRLAPGAGRGGSRDRALTREVLVYSTTSLGARLSINLKDRIAPFVVERAVALEAVKVFGVAPQLLAKVRDVMNALFGGQFLASFAAADGAGEDGALRQLRFSLKLSAAFAAFAIGGLLSLGEAFVTRWLPPNFVPSVPVLWIMALPFGLFLAHYPAYSLMYSRGAHGRMAIVAGVGSVLGLVLGFALGARWGIRGVAAGAAIDLTLVYLFLFPPQLCKVAGLRLGAYWAPIVRGLVGVGAPVALLHLAVRAWIEPDYWRIVAIGAAYGAVFVTAVFGVVFDRRERRLAMARFGR